MQHLSALRSTSIERVRGVVRVCALATLAFVSAGTAPASTREEVTRLAWETELLEKRVELAASDSFYLLLDPSTSKLKLMLQGAVLRDYSIHGLEVGTPRIAFRQRALATGWQGRVWAGGTLDPARERERQQIHGSGNDSTEADSAAAPAFRIPPTPEEIYVVPHRYHIRYANGLSLEVRPQERDETVGRGTRILNGIRVWFRDFLAAVRKSPEDVVRLRMILEPEDAASLYRAMPPDTRLLILPATAAPEAAPEPAS